MGDDLGGGPAVAGHEVAAELGPGAELRGGGRAARNAGGAEVADEADADRVRAVAGVASGAALRSGRDDGAIPEDDVVIADRVAAAAEPGHVARVVMQPRQPRELLAAGPIAHRHGRVVQHDARGSERGRRPR